MPTLASHALCSGCTSCYSACNKGAISMKADSEGFLHPHVNSDLCVNCGVCETACHILHPYECRKPLDVFAARGEDNIRLQCSSGGIFPLLAEAVVNQGGVVWGVAWDISANTPIAKFQCAESIQNLKQFRGSKYVQAEIGDSFRFIKSQLKDGRKVLFSGTPCQIAGLKHLLHKYYEDLICVEVVCHGAPSPEVFKHYLKEVTNDKSQIISDIMFRAKQQFGYGWRNFGFVIKNRNSNNVESIFLTQNVLDNAFTKAFLSELCNRPSCHDCHSRNLRSGADITIGDFWKLSKYLPEVDDDLGTSLVLVNTPKGDSLFKNIEQRLTCKEQITYEIAIDSTGALIESPPMHPKRELFFKEYKSKGVEKTVIKILGPHFWKRLWFRLLDIQYNIKHKFY